MLIDLLNNLAITSAVLFLAGKFIEKKTPGLMISFKTKIFSGLGSGLLGTLFILSTIQVTETVIVDLRQIAIIIAAIYGGPISALISAIIIGSVRIILFGLNEASIGGFLVSILIGIFCSYMTKTKLSLMSKYIYMNVFSLMVVSFAIYYLINNPVISQEVFIYYWPISSVASVFTFYVADYIMKSNENSRYISRFKEMAENSTDLISTHQFDGIFLYVSPSCKKLLGYESDELIGKNPYNFFHPEDSKEIQKSHFKVNQSLSENIVTYRMKRKDGQYIWLETTSKNMNQSNDKPNEILCISRDITDRKQIEDDLMEKNSKLEKLSNIDGLTQIHNRRYFDMTIQKEWKRAARNSTFLSLIMFDIDHFKYYNDTYGHQQGDECLKVVAKTAQSILHRPCDVTARYGGEEFAIILPETNEEGAMKVAESLRKAIQTLAIPHVNSKVIPVVTISVGVATLFPTPETNYLQIIMNADEALYKAKSDGRNIVRKYEDSSTYQLIN